MHRVQSLMLALSLGLAPLMPVTAQQLVYTTATVTDCGPDASAHAAAAAAEAGGAGGIGGAGGAGGGAGAAPTLLGPGNLIVGMPPCPACDCTACVHSEVYTTTFGAFCPHGTTAMAYTITEVYSGMSGVPTLVDRPHCPPGFTTGVETCTVCGDTPITATMTYPIGGSPYVPGLAVATPTGGAGSPGAPASTPAVPVGGSNGTIPYNGPTAAASNSQAVGTWAFIMASTLLLAVFGL